MNNPTRRDQAALLLRGVTEWWTANTPEWYEGTDHTPAQAIIMTYATIKQLSLGDVTFLVAVGALTMTDGTWREGTDPVHHLNDAQSYLKEANRG